MKYIVYQTINLVNNKIYIGQHRTQNPEIFDGYLGCGIQINMPSSYNKPQSPLQYAVKKYGVKNFRRITLKVFNTLKEALAEEARIVDWKFLKRKDTYNAQLGGLTGYVYDPINQFDLKGNFIKTWKNMNKAAQVFGVSHTAIYNAKKYKNSCCGFFWSSDSTIDVTTFAKVSKCICYKYNARTGKFVETYYSIKEAAQANNVTPQSISVAVMTGQQVVGYYFSTKLLEEYNGKPKVSLRKKTLYVYDLEGNFLTELHSGKEINNYFGIKTSNPIAICIRKEVPYKCYQLSLKKVDKLPKYTRTRFYARPVEVWDINGNFVKEIPTITQATKEYGRGVEKVLKGIQRQFKGYIFKYKVNDIV